MLWNLAFYINIAEILPLSTKCGWSTRTMYEMYGWIQLRLIIFSTVFETRQDTIAHDWTIVVTNGQPDCNALSCIQHLSVLLYWPIFYPRVSCASVAALIDTAMTCYGRHGKAKLERSKWPMRKSVQLITSATSTCESKMTRIAWRVYASIRLRYYRQVECMEFLSP